MYCSITSFIFYIFIMLTLLFISAVSLGLISILHIHPNFIFSFSSPKTFKLLNIYQGYIVFESTYYWPNSIFDWTTNVVRFYQFTHFAFEVCNVWLPLNGLHLTFMILKKFNNQFRCYLPTLLISHVIVKELTNFLPLFFICFLKGRSIINFNFYSDKYHISFFSVRLFSLASLVSCGSLLKFFISSDSYLIFWYIFSTK